MKSKMIFPRIEESLQLPLYVTSVGYWEHQEEIVRPFGFPDFQIHQVLSGKGELQYLNDEEVVGPGDVFVLFPEVPHRYVPLSSKWEVAWVAFNGREAGQLLSFSRINNTGISRLKGKEILEPLQSLIILGEGEAEAELMRSKLIYMLLLDLKQEIMVSTNEIHDEERLRPALQYIHNHLHRNLTLQEIANAAHMSEQYLCRLFKKTLAMRPLEYINQERIRFSKRLMFMKRSKKLYEIAQEVGYDNASYFSAVFKKYSGMSPEQFKKLHGL